MTTMKVDQSLAEVWKWKEQVRLGEKSWGDIPVEERIRLRNEEAEKIKKEFGLKLPTLSLSEKYKVRAS